MDERSVFHLISDFTHEQGVSCVLIGGFAINYYRVTRQTADVDFLITKEDFDKIVGLLEKSGYKKALLQENFAQLQSSRLFLLDVDFMFVDKETLTKIMKEGERLRIVGQTFVVPSLHHLIALKLHSIKHNPKIRITKDLPDIINLIRINKVNVNEKKFKELCLKYGSQEIYNKITEAVK
jgi:hypothetical protein